MAPALEVVLEYAVVAGIRVEEITFSDVAEDSIEANFIVPDVIATEADIFLIEM